MSDEHEASNASLIRDISDTARWSAWCRAVESDRPDAVLHDPLARRLAGERGAAIEAAMSKRRGSTVASLVVRTVSFDRLILARAAEGGIDTVLNLAAGLDTRPYRLAPAGVERWVEVDLPELVAYKNAVLAGETPICPVERVALDLADRAGRRALLAQVGARSRGVLVMTEGLLLYLDADLVTELARDLAAVAASLTWLTDLLHPALLPIVVQSWNVADTGAAQVPRFAPEGGAEFFRAAGWVPREVVSAAEAGEALGRSLAPPGVTLSELQREAMRAMNTYVRLDRGD